jgi:hypothetical protein
MNVKTLKGNTTWRVYSVRLGCYNVNFLGQSKPLMRKTLKNLAFNLC